MDAARRAKYEAWRRRKIFKRVAMLVILLLVLLGGLVLGLRSCDEGDEAENGGNPPDPDSDISIDKISSNSTEGDEVKPGTTEISIQFTGDIFLHEGPTEVARTGENTFDFKPFLTHISPFIDGDLAIANMEIPVDAHGGNQGISSFPLFNAPFEILDALQYAGFNHLISANNHSFDQGFDGLVNTVNSFERAGINHTGMSVDWEDFNTPTIIDVNGIQVGIIAYTDSVNNLESNVPESSRAFAVRRFRSDTLEDVPAMAEDIADLRDAGAELVIAALHWGEEYTDAPTEMQRQIAKELSEVGVDVIMGNHSHTVHPIEWHYRDDGSRTLIMYSLGNFLADQTRLTEASVQSQINDSYEHHPFIGRTQFGMLASLKVTRELDGEITLKSVDVLPTLCMRDFSGNTLGTIDGVSVMPLVDGELPDFVTDEELRTWGRVAYNHVVQIVGEDFIGNHPNSDN